MQALTHRVIRGGRTFLVPQNDHDDALFRTSYAHRDRKPVERGHHRGHLRKATADRRACARFPLVLSAATSSRGTASGNSPTWVTSYGRSSIATCGRRGGGPSSKLRTPSISRCDASSSAIRSSWASR